MWQRQVLRRVVENDIYLPHTCEGVRALVGPEVAAKLDPELGRKLTELERVPASWRVPSWGGS
jgi:hypothetical protein